VLPRPRRRADPEIVRARLDALRRALSPPEPGAAAEPEPVPVPAPVPVPEPEPELVPVRAPDSWRESSWVPGFEWAADPDLDAERSGEPERTALQMLTRISGIRPVVVSIALTALIVWWIVRSVSGSPATVVDLVPGTPIIASAGEVTASTGASPALLVPAPTSTATAPASPSEIVIQVIGEVRYPGLVALPVGSRVADAIEATGGLRSRGSSGGLNLARVLVDGEQVVVSHSVPTSIALPAAGSPAAAGVGTVNAIVDLNAADLTALDALPGVGPVMAGRILAWRSAHGRFTAVEQLREVAGIGARTFEHLRPLVRV